MSPDTSFASLVRRRRVALGMSQAAVADLVGRSASAVRSWERGFSAPSDENVVHTLAAVLGIDEEALRTSVGLPAEVPAENVLDTPGNDSRAFFGDETITEVELDEPGAGAEDDSAGIDGGRPSVELPVSDDQEGQPAVVTALRAQEDDSIAAADDRPAPGLVGQTEAGTVDTSGSTERPAEVPSRSHQEVAPEPVGSVVGSAVSSTRTIPAGQTPAPFVEPSYLDDPDQMTTYWVRAALTVAFFVFLFIVLFWALGRLGDSVGEVFDLFKAAS